MHNIFAGAARNWTEGRASVPQAVLCWAIGTNGTEVHSRYGAKEMTRTARLAVIVSLSLLGLTVAAAAVITAVVESWQNPAGAASAKSFSQATQKPVVTPAPTSTYTRTPTPAVLPSEATSPTAAVTSAAPHLAESPAVAMPAPVPPQRQAAPAPPAQATPSCPSGMVVSGIMDVAFPKEHELVTGIWYVDILGHGSISNKTTATVDISLYVPYIEGLDVDGRLTITGFRGDFDFTPSPGVPRPSTLALQPGQTISYTFTQEGVSSTVLAKTIAWRSDPKYSVSNFTDTTVQTKCPKVNVVSPPQGPSIANTYPRH